MAKTSEVDLRRGIVGSAPAAQRIIDVSQLLPYVLLRDVDRVQQAFHDWWERMDRDGAAALAAPDTLETAVDVAMVRDCIQLTALVRDLGLSQYGWLPFNLRWEFQRVMEHRVSERERLTLTVELPEPLPGPWATPGKSPRRKTGKYGGFRLEDLPKYVGWFVACEVNGIKKKRFARDNGVARSHVYSAIDRVRTLLDCINHPDVAES
jgi:hypothetical protein